MSADPFQIGSEILYEIEGRLLYYGVVDVLSGFEPGSVVVGLEIPEEGECLGSEVLPGHGVTLVRLQPAYPAEREGVQFKIRENFSSVLGASPLAGWWDSHIDLHPN